MLAGLYPGLLAGFFPYGPVAAESFAASHKREEYQPVTLGQAYLDSLVGSFSIAPGYDIQISRQGDSLYCRMFGTAPYVIMPASRQKFFFRYLPAEIEFIGAPGEYVDSLRLKYAAGVIPAARVK